MRKKTALPTQKQLVDENADLRARLDEAEDTLRAIRSGEVDALVVSGVGGDQIFTLKGAELPYRVLIEDMNEGALTLATGRRDLVRQPPLCRDAQDAARKGDRFRHPHLDRARTPGESFGRCCKKAQTRKAAKNWFSPPATGHRCRSIFR